MWFLVALLFIIIIFLAKEFLKKGRFLQDFLASSQSQVVHWEYVWAVERSPGMYNIALSGDTPFSVLLGFELKIFQYTWYDPIGYISSDENNRVVASIYLGRKSVDFYFLLNISADLVQFSFSPECQELVPMKIYPPHFWQRMGFYG